MKVAAVQHDIVWEQPEASNRLLEPLIANAAADGAELIAVPEMFSTGFSMAAERIAEPVDGPSAEFLLGQADRHGVWLCGSIPTISPDYQRPVNQLVVAGPNGIVGRYVKIHPYSIAGETAHYAAGSQFLTLALGGVRCTFFICYDLRFADEFWRTAAGTDLYVIVANWPSPRRLHWQILLRARAIENQAYVLAANRVGTDGNGLRYAGDSALIDPQGEYLGTAADEPTCVIGDVDPAKVAAIRASLPFMQDRR